MALSPETQAKIDKAFADKANAGFADNTLSTDTAALTAAQAKVTDSTTAALAAHQTASTSAHDALAALAVELGFPLPA